ncbi:MAG: DUF465 domain-containing protein [Pseudomonadota bacterium]
MNIVTETTLLQTQLDELRQTHRKLDEEISDLVVTGADTLTISRLKKQKLALKDRIARLEDQLYPDIIA